MTTARPFVELATFRPLSAEAGTAQYALLDVSDDSVAYEDLFGGGDFTFAIHDGPLSLPGPLLVRNEEPHVIVIEGDLVVDGPLVLADNGIYVPLWITGSLIASDLAVFSDAQLFIQGDLRLSGTLVTQTSDAAHLVVHGAATAQTWIRATSRGAVYLPATVPDPIESDALTSRWLPGLGGPRNADRDALIERILAREPLLSAPPAAL